MAPRVTELEATTIWRLLGAGMSEREVRRETGRHRDVIRAIRRGAHPAIRDLLEDSDDTQTTVDPGRIRGRIRCSGCGGLLTERPCRACAVRNLQRPGDPDGRELY